jgi:galactan endo-1,6-beta-galactosidase
MSTPNDITTTIDPNSNWGTWEGWGTSLAWWAKKFGTRDDLADVFFTLGWPGLNGGKLCGLGLNIVRYNAGACSWNSVNGESMVQAPSINVTRQMEGFWTDWLNTDPSSSSWNWAVDVNQRTMMSKAQARGVDHFELFSNSPMWWMCKNHNPSGANDGSENIQSWNLDQHAVYLASIAKMAQDSWGITFSSVEPFNEPSSNWWNGASGTQEGCNISAPTQTSIINSLRSELNNRNLSGVLVAASDENNYDLAISTYLQLFPLAFENVGRVNVHGYEQGNGRRDVLYNTVSGQGRKIWNSEYGENDSTGKELISNLILDFRWLHPTAWVYWQVLDGNGWGLIDANIINGTIGAVSQKFFILAQFTRHIREGMQILDGGSDYTVAAYDAGRQKLILVAVNWGVARYINFDLSKFSQPSTNGSSVARWSTQIGSGDQYADHEDTVMSGTKFWSWFNFNEVQTFEVDNVKL